MREVYYSQELRFEVKNDGQVKAVRNMLNSASVSRDIIGKLGRWRREINNWILTLKRNRRQLTTYCRLHVNFRIKSLRGNSIDCFEVNSEKVVVVLKPGKSGFSRLHVDLNFLGSERCYSRLTSKQSIQFLYKLLIIKYASNMQYVVSCLWFLFKGWVSG